MQRWRSDLFSSLANKKEVKSTHLLTHAMIDPTQCRDLTTMQAVIFVIMYLQASGRLSHCYSYLALAAGSAAQMGIHREYTPISFDYAQVETRKRVLDSMHHGYLPF